MNQYPYYNPYLAPNIIQQNTGYTQQGVLPPQQVLQANGRSSVDAIKLSPNSSVLICDSNEPIIYKCISDSLGNTNIEEYDVTPRKSKKVVEEENIQVALTELRLRIERLENEQSAFARYSAESNHAERSTDEEHDANNEVVQ